MRASSPRRHIFVTRLVPGEDFPLRLLPQLKVGDGIGDDAAGEHHEAHGHGGSNGCWSVIVNEIAEQMIFERFFETARTTEPFPFVEPKTGGVMKHADPA